VVVIGSGCAGLTSAVVAAKHGLRTLVLEKSDFFGGTTAFSGGGAWIPNNAHQKTINVVDSRESAEKYLRNVLGDLYDHDMIASFLQNAPIMLQWMQAHSSVQFKPVALPDYHVGKEGASVGRTILTQEYDGRQLGRQRLRSVRYTLQGYHAFGSMQADPAELLVLSNPFQSMSNLAACIRKITRFGLDVLLYGKGSEMANGNALVGRLVKSCDDAGVELQANSPVARLKRLDDTGAFSVVAEDSQGHAKEFVATKGVILASGGFGRSQDARAYLPHDWSVQPKGNVGDGQRMGREVGAAVSYSEDYSSLPTNAKIRCHLQIPRTAYLLRCLYCGQEAVKFDGIRTSLSTGPSQAPSSSTQPGDASPTKPSRTRSLSRLCTRRE
jgi:aspartate oxidase